MNSNFASAAAHAAARQPNSGYYFRFAPLTLAICASLAQPVQAADTQGTPLQLAPLVVTGVAQQSPVTVVTNPKLPRQPVPASDGTDYLKTIPGFSAVRSGGVNGDPVFRGMFGSRLNLLTNGGVMLGACPNRMDSPASYITPESYDRLTVIKGPQSVIWGPGASAATILFEREPERFSELGGRVDASLLVGSNGRFDRRIDAAAGSEQGYLRLLASRASADDYESGSGDTVPSRWDKWSSDLALGWTPDEDTLLELTAGVGDGEARYGARGMDGSQFARETLGLRFERDNIGEVLQKIEARVYYNYADHVMDNYSLRNPNPNDLMMNMRGPYASNVDRRTLGARLAATWRWDDYQLISGVDAQSNEHRLRRAAGVDTYKTLPWSKDATFNQYGLFGELTWYAADASRVIAGARLDRASAQDERAVLSNMMGMAPRTNPTAGDERSDTLPSAFVRYEQDLAALPATAYIGLGHAQRYPDYWELFSAANQIGVPTAFVSVKPEKTTQLDVGLQYEDGPLQAWVSGYVGQVRDYILFSYGPGANPLHTISWVDNIDARIMGAELGASYRLSEQWKTDASLAYAWGKNSSDDRAMPQIPPLEARLGLGYERGDWSAGALWRLVAAQNRIAEQQGTVVGRDFDESPGFGVFSLNAGYRVSPDVKLSAGIDNLFDKAYSEHLNLAGNAGFGFPAATRIDEPGRTWWARVDMSF
ncbi:TonB-dependent copper receptor [Pseudomonas mangrovi]|uniref:TonB-dependent copper receptor n=1 Tax=Pseudomonas mangrovi TaxID=2161748 RepID=A0A2T5PDQ7_9PSED|nr:TonB-dependent copper receptor [Pseudomonas mangrovi]